MDRMHTNTMLQNVPKSFKIFINSPRSIKLRFPRVTNRVWKNIGGYGIKLGRRFYLVFDQNWISSWNVQRLAIIHCIEARKRQADVEAVRRQVCIPLFAYHIYISDRFWHRSSVMCVVFPYIGICKCALRLINHVTQIRISATVENRILSCFSSIRN